MFFKIMRDKKGFTLIEMLVTLVILGILMGITLGMIGQSANVFTASSKRDVDKGVGDNIFELLESSCRFATHLSVNDLNASDPKASGGYGTGYYIDPNKGILYETNKDTDSIGEPVHPESYYGGRTIRYSITQIEDSSRHVKIELQVFRDGHAVYTRSAVVKCVNLSLLSAASLSNAIKFNAASKYNQYISFNTNEQLLTSDSEGYGITQKAKDYQNNYNQIQNTYVSALTAAESEFEATFSGGSNFTDTVYAKANVDRQNAFKKARDTAQKDIKDLLGFVPTANGTYNTAQTGPIDFTNVNYYHYLMAGVVASKEELFTGFLLKYYDENNDKIISESEYPHFANAETFFSNTIFDAKKGGQYPADDLVQMTYFSPNFTDYDDIVQLKTTDDQGNQLTGSITIVNTTTSDVTDKIFMSYGSGTDQIKKLRAAYAHLSNYSSASKNDILNYFPDYGYTYLGSVDDRYSSGYYLNSSYVGSITRTSTGRSSDGNMYNVTLTLNNTLPAGYYYVFTGCDSYWTVNLGTWWGTYLTYAGFNVSHDLPAGSIISFEIMDGNGDSMGHDVGVYNSDGPDPYVSDPYYKYTHSVTTTTSTTVSIPYYSFGQAHQFDDEMTYAAEYSTWIGSSNKGLINQFLGWITGTNSQVEVSAANPQHSYGRQGNAKVGNINNGYSYNYALACYHPKRNVWFYIPTESSLMGEWINGSIFLSNSTTPNTYDMEIGKTTNGRIVNSSDYLSQDIDNNSTGIAASKVDTSASASGISVVWNNLAGEATGDTLWVALPVG